MHPIPIQVLNIQAKLLKSLASFHFQGIFRIQSVSQKYMLCSSFPFLTFNNCVQISMISLTDFLKSQQSISIQELQNRVHSTKPRRQQENKKPPTSDQPDDLKVLSPFYKRIDQHVRNCKCFYHKRVKTQASKVGRFRPGQLQVQSNNRQSLVTDNRRSEQIMSLLKIEENILQQQPDIYSNGRVRHQGRFTSDFNEWMNKLSSQQLNNKYLEYLKSLPNISKFKRHKQLDCHNLAFQQFLKSRYLVLLDKTKTQNQLIKESKEHHSRKHMLKIKTEGNIDREKLQTNKTINQKENPRYTEASEGAYPSMKETNKLKKIGFKGTGKTFELSEEDPNDRKQKRKRTKFVSSRPSFFGLIEDQQILRELCLRFMHQNRSQNKEAEMMLKQLVDADLDMYIKLMNDIEEDLQEGIQLKNLDSSCTNKLVKIVLHKMNKSIQSSKAKDQHYEEKNNIMEDLYNKYGWSKDQKPIGLNQFWKITQSIKNYSNSRNSLAPDRGSRLKLERGNSLASQKKIDRDRRNQSKVGNRQSRMSGFSGQKSYQRLNSNQNSSSFNSNNKNFTLKDRDEAKEKDDQNEPQQQFRFNNNHQAKNILKKGGLLKKNRGKKLSTLNDGLSFSKGKGSFGGNLVRKQTCFFKGEEDEYQYTPAEQQGNKHQGVSQFRSPDDDRTSSMFLFLKSHVLRHIETNKKFLKRVEHELLDKQCSQLIIGIGAGILTKKRKIRAIYEALQKEQDKKSTYYNDLLKYLQIYEEYCDLVVKVKKDRKIKSEASLGRESERCLKQKTEEDVQQLNTLLDDLKKERELKYLNLKWIQDREDPKEEIIIKMPEYSTQTDKILERRKKEKEKQEKQKVQVKFLEFQQVEDSILQKDLQFKVNMYCQSDNREVFASKDHLLTLIEEQPTRKMPEFQGKILKYRKMLGLALSNDDI